MRASGHRALIITEKGLASAAFIDAWLKEGNSVAALWTMDKSLFRSNGSQNLLAFASAIPTIESQIKKFDIPVFHINGIARDSKAASSLADLGADTLITFATYQIIPAWFLEIFGDRAVNAHPSLLPHYKGPRPMRSLLADGKADKHGGFTLHRLDAGIDTGPIIGQRPVPLSPGRDYNIWSYKLALAAADLAQNELQTYLAGNLAASAQVEGSGNYRKSSPLEFLVEPGKTLGQARKLLSLPGSMPLHACPDITDGIRKTYRIGRSLRLLSKPSGMPPKVTPFSVEMDIRDSRVRIGRKRKATLFLQPSLSIAVFRFRQYVARKG